MTAKDALSICVEQSTGIGLCRCLEQVCPIIYNNSREQKESCYMDHCFISKRSLENPALYRITSLYLIIFIIGVIGNITTCVVMKRHPMLKTHASIYLTNLAISDLVTLFVGLPFEVFMNWNQYPWPFPDFVCNLKALIAETTSSVSILTILFFAVERYVAVCHPFWFVKIKPFKQKVHGAIILTWIISIACALPFAYHHKADYILKSWPGTDNHEPVVSSKMCMVAVFFEPRLMPVFHVLFHLTALIFFAIPLFTILILYGLIATKVSVSRQPRREVDITEELHMKINLILCGIVIAFFVCYLPFHLQRLLFFYLHNDVIISTLNQYIFFISGILFYLATIINPIMYNLASSRFRKASKEVIFSFFFSRVDNSAVRSSSGPIRYTITPKQLRQTHSQGVSLYEPSHA